MLWYRVGSHGVSSRESQKGGLIDEKRPHTSRCTSFSERNGEGVVTR